MQRQLSRQKSRVSESEPPAEKVKEIKKKPAVAQEVQESVEVGKVSWNVYKMYVTSMGLAFALMTLVQLVLYSGSSVFSSIWLSQWTGDPVFATNHSDAKDQAVTKYLGVYGGLGVAQSKSIGVNSAVAKTLSIVTVCCLCCSLPHSWIHILIR